MTERKPPVEPPQIHTPQPQPVTMNDMLTALGAMQNNHAEPSMQKAIVPIAIAITIGLLGWVGTTLGTLTTTVATMQPSLVIIQKSVDGLSATQKDTTDRMANMQATVAQHSLRLDNLEGQNSRTNDRMRLLEGTKPLSHLQYTQ